MVSCVLFATACDKGEEPFRAAVAIESRRDRLAAADAFDKVCAVDAQSKFCPDARARAQHLRDEDAAEKRRLGEEEKRRQEEETRKREEKSFMPLGDGFEWRYSINGMPRVLRCNAPAVRQVGAYSCRWTTSTGRREIGDMTVDCVVRAARDGIYQTCQATGMMAKVRAQLGGNTPITEQLLAFPIGRGRTWICKPNRTRNTQCRIGRTGFEQETPAGKFANCIEVIERLSMREKGRWHSVTDTSIWCPGVGLVKEAWTGATLQYFDFGEATPRASEKISEETLPAAAAEPEALVKELYGKHTKSEKGFENTFKSNRALFAPGLAAVVDRVLIKVDKVLAGTSDEAVLDFDPLLDAQDRPTKYEVGNSTKDGSDALVPVTLWFDDSQKKQIKVRLTEKSGKWLISNVIYEKQDMLAVLKKL
jgi:hypothetical protein